MLSSPVEEIKNRLDIVEVVSSYIKLQKTGANLRAVCPFHSEKKPSLFVSPARQIWHCFGCSAGGDIFKFVMQIEGVEFGDALRILAQRAGVELKRQSPESAAWRTERQHLYEICELAARFFEKQLEESTIGKEARQYLLNRGLTVESLKKWRVGYAPDVWQGLSDFLTLRGYQKEEIEKAGLALTSEKGSFYDRFRGRIIFPIFDLNSQVIGFGGRVFKEKDKTEIAKYVNTPNTLLYDKSRVLYGLDKAKLNIRKKDFCVLVEGYIDVIMSFQAGIENAVATSGTALTLSQLKFLKRYSDNLLTAFDMDIAGDSATKRGIDLAQTQGFNIKVITMPEGNDPADIVFQNPQAWAEKIAEAKSILQFYFDTTLAHFDSETPEGKRNISKILLPVIKKIPNEIEKFHWVQELAKRLKVKEEAVGEELKKIKLDLRDFLFDREKEQVLPPKSRQEMLEEKIVSLVLKAPHNLELINNDCLSCFSPEIQTILTGLKNGNKLAEDDFLNYLYLKAETEEGEIEPEAEIQACLEEIKRLGIKIRLGSLSEAIKEAEGEKDDQKVNVLTQKFKDTATELTNL